MSKVQAEVHMIEMVNYIGGFSIKKDIVETSFGHKKEKNGQTHEAPLEKLSKVDDTKQTIKGKKALDEITEDSTDNI